MKDSWWTAYVGPVKGYFFYRDDYLRLKALAFLVHREAIASWLAKFGEK
jgi:bleomycin hydrolase